MSSDESDREDAPQEDKSAIPDDEPRYIPKIDAKTANTTNGNMYGVQADTVNGGINNYYNDAGDPDLAFRRQSTEEIDESREQFVAPGGFDKADQNLRTSNVAVLCGRGTGRSHAGRRLLIDRGAFPIIDVNRARSIGSVRESELERGTGYLWDVSGSTKRPFADHEFTRCANVMKAAGCWLVLVLDHDTQSTETAMKHTVTLTAPPPVEVALSALQRRHPLADESASITIKNDLAAALEGAPPDKAARTADLAVRVSSGQQELGETLASLREEVATAVARWFENQGIREYALAFAVALLEHQPYEDVIQLAVALDKEVRKARLPEKKKENLRARCVFDRSKAELLQAISATTVIRDHPRHKGLREETIRFERQDWAAGVLTHVWSEYPAAREVLRDWMCGEDMFGRFADASVRALFAIVTTVPAHEPLEIVKDLGSARRYSHRILAAATFAQLADDEQLHPLVMRILQVWIKYGSAYQLWTVAKVYSSSYGRRDLPDALKKLTLIGKSLRDTPQNAVVAGTLSMLRDKKIRAQVIDTVVSWAEPRYRRTGLRHVSLSLALWVSGFFSDANSYFVEFSALFPRQVRELFQRALSDHEFGPIVLDHLAELAQHARWDERKAVELIRLTRLITPDLRWQRRRHVVEGLCFQHPTKRTTIRRIFQLARKVQRKYGSGTPVDITPPPERLTGGAPVNRVVAWIAERFTNKVD